MMNNPQLLQSILSNPELVNQFIQGQGQTGTTGQEAGQGTNGASPQKSSKEQQLQLDYPLLYLAGYGTTEELAQLLEEYQSQGKDINEVRHKTDGKAAIHYAVIKNNLEHARMLIEAGAKLNLREMKEGYQPLHYAVSRKNTEMIELLLNNKADPNAKTRSNVSPIINAVYMDTEPRQGFEERKKIVELYLKQEPI